MKDPLIPAAALEGLMKKAFQEQAVNPGLFWDALLNAHLVVPLAAEREEKEGQIPILLGVDSEGNHVVWLFTSSQAMVEYIERDQRFLVMPSRDLFNQLQNNEHEIVLIGPDGLTLNMHPDLIASLAEGRVPEQPQEEIRNIPKDTSVMVGSPSEDTSALESKFKELFANVPDVLEACFIQIADDSGSRLLLGVRLTDESKDRFKQVAGLVAKAAEGVLEPGKTMDITLLDRSMKGAFEKWGKSFFKR